MYTQILFNFQLNATLLTMVKIAIYKYRRRYLYVAFGGYVCVYISAISHNSCLI